MCYNEDLALEVQASYLSKRTKHNNMLYTISKAIKFNMRQYDTALLKIMQLQNNNIQLLTLKIHTAAMHVNNLMEI